MLGRIATVSITTPDLPGSIDAYHHYLGYRVVEDGALPRELARAWHRPQLAGRRVAVLEPDSGQDTYLRFIEGPACVDYHAFRCLGWNAAGLIVMNVDEAAARLAHSPFRIIGPPADLAVSEHIRAMQVVGPAREALHLTAIRRKLPMFDTPEARSFIDRPFIVALGGANLESLQDYYQQRLGLPRAPVMRIVNPVRSAQFDLPPDHLHETADLPLPGHCHIEAAAMPPAARPRPCEPGELPPGIAMVSFEIDALPPSGGGADPAIACVSALPYDGRRCMLCVGAAGELIELVERG